MTTTRNSGAASVRGGAAGTPRRAPAGTDRGSAPATASGAARRPRPTGRRRTVDAPVLSERALNRATLARQHLLTPAAPDTLGTADALSHLLGLQAQNVKPPYYGLAARIDGFDPGELSALMADRAAVRMVTLRSTVHTHTAADALALRPFAQGALDRELAAFRKGLVGVDLDRLTALSRELVETEPRTPAQLRAELRVHWPDADPLALTIAARCRLSLVQVTPRGLWRRSGRVALTTVEQWLGRAAEPAPVEEVVRRYLAAFGPASVKDMQTWAGVTRLRDAFERLRPALLTFRDARGTELFDLPDAPRPDEDTEAPPRLLPEYDNLLLSHADRTRLVPAEVKGLTWRGNHAYCVLMVDGLVAGVWKLEETGAAAVLTVEPFAPLTETQRAGVLAEGARLLGLLADPSADQDVRFGAVRHP
ncbi:winged helix DNA-binding domain-containing protein [Streptomyces sp. NPDC059816]|uniref:winged helix DNA-binding domain-containing protein n=1 Tax=Streptomyces sp. NPDC059816 TaxID=3346960 RepID=UPI00364E34A1